MKHLHLLFLIFFFFISCYPSDKKIATLVMEEFPLTYQNIKDNAEKRYGDTSIYVSTEINEQCKYFAITGYMLSNPEKICGIEKETFNAFFELAVIRNSQNKNFDLSNLYKCMGDSITLDQKCACLNSNWNGVFNTLIEEIEKFRESKNKPQGKFKDNSIFFV